MDDKPDQLEMMKQMDPNFFMLFSLAAKNKHPQQL